MRILNLYGGLGGNRKHWNGHQITTLEMDEKIAAVYRKLYPEDELIVGDAHQYLLENSDNFDMVWSSPPCQSHSRMMKATRHRRREYPDFSLYQQVVFLTHFFKGKWVVENVKPYYQPLIPPTQTLGRHIFWSNFDITPFHMKNHESFIVTDSVSGAQKLKEWLGIHYEGNLYYGKNHSPAQVLRNCVHPDLGAHILSCAEISLLNA